MTTRRFRACRLLALAVAVLVAIVEPADAQTPSPKLLEVRLSDLGRGYRLDLERCTYTAAETSAYSHYFSAKQLRRERFVGQCMVTYIGPTLVQNTMQAFAGAGGAQWAYGKDVAARKATTSYTARLKIPRIGISMYAVRGKDVTNGMYYAIVFRRGRYAVSVNMVGRRATASKTEALARLVDARIRGRGTFRGRSPLLSAAPVAGPTS